MRTHHDLPSNIRLSLASVILTALAITFNHTYTLGAAALVLGAALIAVPVALAVWFSRSGSRTAYAGYLLMTAWIVVGFGLMKGLWGTTLRVFEGTLLASRSAAFPRPPIGTLGFEMSGILMFIGSVFVLYYTSRLIARPHVRLAVNAGWTLAALAMAVGYAFTSRDRWLPPTDGIVRIGVIVPTEGPYAVLGNSFVKAVQMAKDDLNNTRYRYELVIRDSGPDPAKARDVIRKVIAENKVDAIVGGISLIGQVTKTYATNARIPHTCVCTVTSIGDGAYNFTNIPSPEAEGVLWVQEARRRGIERIALVTQNYPSINNHVKALKV